MSALPRPLLMLRYEKWAEEYLKSLPLEHFMEAKPQATQRAISVESLELAHAARPDIQFFSEMLVQSPRRGRRKPLQVVPDNMVVLHNEPLTAKTSYDIPLQPSRPFWMLEYVTKSSERKDYEKNFRIYERRLKVPYYLIFYPDNQEMTLFVHNGGRYVTARPNHHGRYEIPELEIEVAILDGWVRFWFRGELLPLPTELQSQLNEARAKLKTESKRANEAERRANEAESRLENEQRLRQDLQRQIEALKAKLDPPPQ